MARTKADSYNKAFKMANVKAMKEKKEGASEQTSTEKPIVPKKPREKVKPGSHRHSPRELRCVKKFDLYEKGINIEGVHYTYAPLLLCTGIFQNDDCTGLSKFEPNSSDDSDEEHCINLHSENVIGNAETNDDTADESFVKKRKKGSTSKGTGNSYCPRPKPTWQLSMDKFFPKHGEPLVLKSVRKKPEETAVASDEMVEGFCSVDESGSKNAVPNKSADDVDSENAGKVDRETADPSKKVHM